MFPGLCGTTGLAGWLVMLAAWAGMIALTVWAVTKLFPSPSGPSAMAAPEPRRPDRATPPVESGRP